jgi:hypothetical protein
MFKGFRKKVIDFCPPKCRVGVNRLCTYLCTSAFFALSSGNELHASDSPLTISKSENGRAATLSRFTSTLTD